MRSIGLKKPSSLGYWEENKSFLYHNNHNPTARQHDQGQTVIIMTYTRTNVCAISEGKGKVKAQTRDGTCGRK